MEKFSNYWLIQESVYENIKFADTKATALVPLNLAIIAGLYTLKVFEISSTILFAISCIAFISLTLSIICSVFVIIPRGNSKKQKSPTSICDLNTIGELKSFDEYKSNVSSSDETKILEDILLLIYNRSKTNKTKYLWLKREIIFGAIGWALGIIVTSVLILG